MAISYIGPTELEQANGGLSKNVYGFDVARRVFNVRAEDIEIFLDGFDESSAHPTYPDLFFESAEDAVAGLGPYRSVVLLYKGLIGGVIPAEVVSFSAQLTTVQLTTSTGVDIDVGYYARTATISFVTDEKPSEAGIYSAKLDTSADPRIAYSIPVSATGVVTEGVHYAINKILHGLSHSEVVGGRYYQATETWQQQIVTP